MNNVAQRAALGSGAMAVCVAGTVLVVLSLLASPRLQPYGLGVLQPISVPLAAVGASLLLAGGLALAAAYGWSWLRRYYASPGAILAVMLISWAASALALVLALLLDPGARGLSVLGLVLSSLAMFGSLFAAVYWIVVRPGIIPWRAMGLTRADLQRVGWLLPVVASAGLLGVNFVTGLVLNSFGVRQTQLESLGWLRGAPLGQFLAVMFVAAVLAPVVEEIFFRGYVFRALLGRHGLRWAYLFSSALFALVHLNLQALLPIFLVGLFLAYLYQRTGTIVPGMVAHTVNNLVAFSALYFLP